MLGNFKDKSGLAVSDLKGIEDWWQVIVKLDINNGTNNCNNSTLRRSLRFRICGSPLLT
jgi:hypothetical protein